MSSAAAAAAAASKAAANYLQFRIQYSSIAFLYYDYALTFPAEVKYIWGRKLRLPTVLYIFCRYALVANILFALAKLDKLGARVRTPLSNCDVWYKFVGAISILGRAAVIAALTGRTYAVYGGNRYILVFLASLGITCIGLDITHAPGLKCVGGGKTNQTAATMLSILMCVFEFSAAILMTIRSAMELRIAGTWKLDTGSIQNVVFKQGIMYFGVMSIFTTAAAVLNFRAEPGSFFQRLPNAYTLPVSCTLIARFLLQLREYQEKDFIATSNGGQAYNTHDSHPQTLTSLRTVAVFDSMMLDDFGDGELSPSGIRSSAWETGSSHTHHGDVDSEKAHSEAIRAGKARNDSRVLSTDEVGQSSGQTIEAI